MKQKWMAKLEEYGMGRGRRDEARVNGFADRDASRRFETDTYARQKTRRDSSGEGRSAPRAHTAFRRPWASGDGFGRGEGKLRLRKDVHQLLRIRRQFAIFADPAREERLGSFFDPLLEQGGDLFTQIGGMIQTRKLEALQRRIRCLVQEAPCWSEAVGSHTYIPLCDPVGDDY